MPDASVQFVHAIIAGLIERPDLAWPIATRLTRPGRPAAVRAEGYAALAHLALSRGQVQVAGKMLDTLSQQNATEAAWWRSYFATLPFMPADSNAARDAMQALAITPSRATSAPLTLDLSVNAPVAEVIQRYSTALLAARRGQRMTETLGCGTLASPSARDLCDDLERGLRAEAAMRRGDDGAALRELQAMTMRVPYQLAGRSVYFARTRERFLRAQLLERAGHLSEAYDWYAGVPHGGRLDYVYLAASHLGRARIRERQGDRPAAAAHYQSASQLLAQSDGLMGLRDAARAGLERTAR